MIQPATACSAARDLVSERSAGSCILNFRSKIDDVTIADATKYKPSTHLRAARA